MDYLLEFFKNTLDQEELTKVALIGVGNLWTAFLNYNFTRNNNTKIVKAFDRSRRKSETNVGGVPIYHIDDLEAELSDVEIAILTVPQTEAQEITNKLVEKGVTGILNFTPARLTIPGQVRVHHVDLSIELQSLAYFMKHYSNEK